MDGEKTTLTVGSLFAGIGGIELGLERAQHERYQFKTVWQVECDQYAQKVLAKHWPDCGRWDDVRTFPPAPAEDWRCDVICGGFPCQDISDAGKRRGLHGERSGLFFEAMRIVRALRPRFVIIENVAALRFRGLDGVLCEIAESGYDAEWDIIPAAAVGSPQIRNRCFIVAYSEQDGWNFDACMPASSRLGIATNASRIKRTEKATVFQHRGEDGSERTTAGMPRGDYCKSESGIALRRNWDAEPRVCRVGDGVPAWLDRLACLGNAVVPQVAQWIGERILEALP